jgi:predicted AlkP superfamily phosphohydrolase/phosphomutase
MTTVVLGLDGAGFELLDPWIGQDLPNLEKIRSNGVSAELQPCYPPVTCPNWQCYAKAKNPGKLGVFWWEKVDRERNTIKHTSSVNDFDGHFYWDYLDDQRAVLNLPTSYPPLSTNGVHVSGGPGTEQTGYTSPPDFEDTLREEYDYYVHPKDLSELSPSNPNNECVNEIYELIDRRFDVLIDIIEDNDFEFVHMSIFYINMLQHFYWNHDVVKTAWEKIDARIGELIQSEELDDLIIMSDHGSNEVDTWFRINTWLENNGYLVTETGMSDWLAKTGITKDRVRSLLGTFGIEWWARKIVPSQIQAMLPDTDGTIDQGAKSHLIDWENSQAIASGQGPIYILSNSLEERKKLREKLISELSGLCDEEGKLVLRDAFAAEEVYEGPHVSEGPDMIVDQAPGVHVDGGIGSNQTFDQPQKWSGENTMSGLFLAYGENITEDWSRDKIKITDIGPSVLHLKNATIPADMDGEVLLDLFSQDSDARSRNPEISTDVGAWMEEETNSRIDSGVGERLEDLGYLS